MYGSGKTRYDAPHLHFPPPAKQLYKLYKYIWYLSPLWAVLRGKV